jgi:serine/threonine protein kinase
MQSTRRPMAESASRSARWQGRAVEAAIPGRAVQALRQPEISGYRIDRIVGEGRVATVYLADDARRGGKVALKVLKGSCGQSPAVRQGFAAECAILSVIRHENVVPALEHGAGGDPCYLVLEYLGGGTLRQRMQRGIAPELAFTLLRQAAAGLAQVHRAGFVHRDVKPENFLMRDPGQVVLVDFGVAAASGENAPPIAPGRLIGTACYAAPEQAQGDPPNPAADVYSLGIVLYEMLRGRRPFPGATVLEALSQHLVAPVPRLPSQLAVYQPLVDRMLEKNPQRRLPDADAVLQESECMAPAGFASISS